MSYPVAYRSVEAREKFNSGFRELTRTPTPANTNMPRPANDNRRPRPRVPFGKAQSLPSAARPISRAVTARALAGLGRLVLPGGLAISAALLLWELYRQYQQNAENGPNAPGNSTMHRYGWTLTGVCPLLRGSNYTGRISMRDLAPFFCFNNSGSSPLNYEPIQTPANATRIHRLPEFNNAGNLREDTREIWDRPAGQPASAVPGVRATPYVWPSFPPAADPFSLPIKQPMPGVPMPLPHSVVPARQPNPYRSPTEQTEWGNAVPRTPLGTPPLWFLPPILPPPGAVPPRGPIRVRLPDGSIGEVPIPDIVIQPGRPLALAPPGHRFQPPKTREKERKVKVRNHWLGKINAWLVSPSTEAIDVVEAFYDALPKKIRTAERLATKPYLKYQDRPMPWFPKDDVGKGPGTQRAERNRYLYNYGKKYADEFTDKIFSQQPSIKRKLRAIEKHFDKIDVSQVIAKILYDQLIDEAYGRLGRAQGKAAKRAGRVVGYQVGPAL